MELVFKNRH